MLRSVLPNEATDLRRVIVLALGCHDVNALTGSADNFRHDAQWQ
jgi:hypothetical protein